MPAFDDEDRSLIAARHVIGQDLGTLSLDEIAHRIILLKEEVLRLEDAMRAKSAQRSAADRLFGSQ